jgi:hypothetical protein
MSCADRASRHADTSSVAERANVFTGPLSRKNSNYLVIICGVGREIDAPARAGILASFEPEGEAAFVTFVTPVEERMGRAD